MQPISATLGNRNIKLELPEDKWVLAEGESNGHPYFMLVNDSFKFFPQKSEYSYCLITTTKLEIVQGHKLPTDEETEVLNRMEDILMNHLSKITLPLLIGRETYLGKREILIYFPKLTNYKFTIDKLSQDLNSLRKTHLELHNDPEWKKADRYLGTKHNA